MTDAKEISVDAATVTVLSDRGNDLLYSGPSLARVPLSSIKCVANENLLVRSIVMDRSSSNHFQKKKNLGNVLSAMPAQGFVAAGIYRH